MISKHLSDSAALAIRKTRAEGCAGLQQVDCRVGSHQNTEKVCSAARERLGMFITMVWEIDRWQKSR